MARRNRSAVGGVAANRRMNEMRRIVFVLIALALAIAAGPLSTAGATNPTSSTSSTTAPKASQFSAVATSPTVIEVTLSQKTSSSVTATATLRGTSAGTCTIQSGKTFCDITGLSPATAYSVTISGVDTGTTLSVRTQKAPFSAVATSPTVIEVTLSQETSSSATATATLRGTSAGTCTIQSGKTFCDIIGLSPATSYSVTISGDDTGTTLSVPTPKAAAPTANLAHTGAIKTGDVITVWWHAGEGVEDVEASATFTGSTQEQCVQSNASSQSASGSTTTSTATCPIPRSAVISKRSPSIRLTSYTTTDGSQSGLGRTQVVALTLPAKPAAPSSPSWWLFLLSGLVGLVIGVVVDRLVKTRRPAHIVDPALQHPQPGTTNGALAASSRTTPPPPAATLRKVAVLDGRPAPSEGRLVGVADPEGFAEFSDGIVRRVRMVDGRPGLPDEQVSPVQD